MTLVVALSLARLRPLYATASRGGGFTGSAAPAGTSLEQATKSQTPKVIRVALGDFVLGPMKGRDQNTIIARSMSSKFRGDT